MEIVFRIIHCGDFKKNEFETVLSSVIDAHFKSTAKLRGGKIIECVPSKVLDPSPLFLANIQVASAQTKEQEQITSNLHIPKGVVWLNIWCGFGPVYYTLKNCRKNATFFAFFSRKIAIFHEKTC